MVSNKDDRRAMSSKSLQRELEIDALKCFFFKLVIANLLFADIFFFWIIWSVITK